MEFKMIVKIGRIFEKHMDEVAARREKGEAGKAFKKYRDENPSWNSGEITKEIRLGFAKRRQEAAVREAFKELPFA